MRAREIVVGGLLTALALLIPIVFRGYLQVYIPPFSATLFSHVPQMLAMLVSPAVAVLVGLGSTFGFLVTLGPVVAARAFVHVWWGVLGAVLVRRGWPLWASLLVALPVHALGEALVVLLFGFPVSVALIQVGVGTALHHTVDAVAALALARVLGTALASRNLPLEPATRRLR
jgi:niacin transporter